MDTKNNNQKIKTELEKERKELEAQLKHMEEYKELEMGESIAELATYDNHPADIGSELYERSKDIALAEGIKHKLQHVGNALDKINTNNYGICDMCGKEISADRLEAMPSTTLCLKCKELKESETDNNRPVEEEVLNMVPQNYKGLDNMYDGENVWRDLARYGTSDTPQDSERPGEYQDLIEDNEDDGLVEKIEGIPYVSKKDGMFYEETYGVDEKEKLDE
ncbi:YteA family regulatory protein [Desulfitispora alkaliphila]|uniref:TraR/DksA C4-type zinc finger protein n=1 Tax=Desulfitispora alkaliphila TaxID=622674 RepID=UPI003D25E312